MVSLLLVMLFVSAVGTALFTSSLDVTIATNAKSEVVASQSRSGSISDVYSYVEMGENITLPCSWVDVEVSIKDYPAHIKLLDMMLPTPRLPGNVSASFFVQQPVYVSLTTMASRLHNVNTTILGLIQARMVPDKIYLLISKDAYLLDDGVTSLPDNLLCLAAAGYLNIVYTSNQGPHRKLLPVLRRYWDKDVFIATVDDDMGRSQAYAILYQLLKTYVHNNRTDSVVALRARRISVCNTPPYRVTRYFSWPVVFAHNVQEMLLMPTGTGGILYKPSYFHKAIFMESFRHATGTADDLMFRLATMMNNIPVLLGCSVLYHRGQLARSCKYDALDKTFDSVHGMASSVYYKELLAETLSQLRKAYAAAHRNSTLPTNTNTAPINTTDTVAATTQLPTPPTHTLTTITPKRTIPSPDSITSGARTNTNTNTNTNINTNPESTLGVALSAEQKKAAQWEEILNNVLQPPLRRLVQHTASVSFSDAGAAQPTIEEAKCRGGSHSAHAPSPDAHTARQLVSKDLFSINKRGGNGYAWKLALSVLKSQHFLFENVTEMYIHERESSCFAPNRSVRVERNCGLFECKGKPKSFTSIVLK